MILRRLYLYLVSLASLILLAVGVANFGNTLLLFIFHDPTADYNRSSLAYFAAAAIVAAPVWAIHFFFAQRFARRDPSERASTIRRLYVYVACLSASLAATFTAAFGISHLLRPLVDTCPPIPQGVLQLPGCGGHFEWVIIAQAAWSAAVLLVIWAFHLRIAIGDRALAGEQGASATLRRWYMYIALLVGLLMMLTGVASTVELTWLRLLNSDALKYSSSLGDAIGTAIAGGALWAFHARFISRRYVEEDRQATLRALEGFFVVSVSIALAVFGASQILYYLLARALGVTNLSTLGTNTNNVAELLAAPVSGLVVYGAAWFLERRRLASDAGPQEGPRQAGIRRLYTNLAALVSLVAMATGAGGVLATLAEQFEAPLIGVPAPDWKNPLSQYLTLLVVGAAVWLAHWRHAPWAAERQALSRKLYVWAALLGSVLSVLGTATYLLYAVLNQFLKTNPRLDDPTNLDFARYLAALVVALGVGFYHWRVLRADSASKPATPQLIAATPQPAKTPEPVPAATATAHAMRYVLTVSDATEDDLHQALATLPPHASYRLTASEEQH